MEYIKAKTIVTNKNGKGWFGTDYTMNIYRGCCHGCIYCDSRSSCYGIEDFDKVRAKENSTLQIRSELRKKIKKGVIGTGAMSDPYNPFEEKYELTRKALEIIDENNFGVAIATKGKIITRDIDILKDIQKHSPVLAKITITTYKDELSKKIEPGVAPSSERFSVVNKLSENGIFTGILLMPVLPFIEDNHENIIKIVKLAYESGAKFIYPAFGMTLRDKQRAWYFKNLDEKFSGLKKSYLEEYGSNYECRSPRAKELWSVFALECDKYGILYEMKDIVKAYRMKYEINQISLFD